MVDAHVEDVQVEVEANFEVDIEVDIEVTSSKQTTEESIENILEKDGQSGLLEIRNSFIDAVIDQALATTSNQDKCVQPKLSKNAKKRQWDSSKKNQYFCFKCSYKFV